jgi:3-methyl-2-oxobutanoate hydroxymethyltransferase
MSEVPTLYGGPPTRRVRTRDLLAAKTPCGDRWPMLTSYDMYTAAIFDQGRRAGPAGRRLGRQQRVRLRDHRAGHLDELIPLVRAVVRATKTALVVGDLPFGSYEEGPTQALRTAGAVHEGGRRHAVKLEGGRRVAAQIEAITSAGIPVMAHIGFTPQSEHTSAATASRAARTRAPRCSPTPRPWPPRALRGGARDGSGEVAKTVTKELSIPTVGIGAGPDTDAQVLVWQDMAGLRTGKAPRFVKRYADLAGVLGEATRRFADEVRHGEFPAAEHTFE